MGAGSGGPGPSNPLLQRGLPQGTLVADPPGEGGGGGDGQRRHQHEQGQGQGQGHQQQQQPRQQEQQEQQQGELNLPSLSVPFGFVFSEVRIRKAFETGHYGLPSTIKRSTAAYETDKAAEMLREHEKSLHRALLEADRKIVDDDDEDHDHYFLRFGRLGMGFRRRVDVFEDDADPILPPWLLPYPAVAPRRVPLSLSFFARMRPAPIIARRARARSWSDYWKMTEMRREAEKCLHDLENGMDRALTRAKQLCEEMSAQNDDDDDEYGLNSVRQRLLSAVQSRERAAQQRMAGLIRRYSAASSIATTVKAFSQLCQLHSTTTSTFRLEGRLAFLLCFAYLLTSRRAACINLSMALRSHHHSAFAWRSRGYTEDLVGFVT